MSQSGALPVKGAVLNVVSRSLQTGATEGGDDGGTDEAASATAAASIEPPCGTPPDGKSHRTANMQVSH